MLRLGGSLLQGRVPATGIMRTLQVGENPTRLAQNIAEFGRIDKTLHSLRFIGDKDMRRGTLHSSIWVKVGTVLDASFSASNGANCASGIPKGGRSTRHSRTRRQYDRLWNTIYMEAVLEQFRKEGYPVNEEDKGRLSPLIEHINTQGRHSFVMPEAVVKGELRPLRNPADDPD